MVLTKDDEITGLVADIRSSFHECDWDDEDGLELLMILKDHDEDDFVRCWYHPMGAWSIDYCLKKGGEDMYLFDLLKVVEPYNDVIIYRNHNEVARYDGGEIDSDLKYSHVRSVFATYDEYEYHDCIGVEIEED